MKKCFKCGKEKPLSEFYKHPQMGDGHLGKCKECATRDSQERYLEKRKDMEWFLSERERSREKSHRLNYQSHYTPEQKKEIMRRFKENHPDKIRAANLVANAIRDNRLKKRPCEICGDNKVQAHHEDYSKPLEVRWLCIKHHNERHVELRRLKTIEEFETINNKN